MPQTKNDLQDIRRTVKMLGISDVKELVDATAEEIDKAYEELCDKIIA